MRTNQDGPRQWLLPLLSLALFFGFLLLVFPFNSGDSATRSPLGLSLWSMWTTSSDTQDYTYCLLVPLAVAYLIYEKRQKLLQLPTRGNTAAVAWILLGLIVFWVGARAGKQYIGCGAVQILLAGFIVWFWGGAMFRLLFFPWVFLTFAWPFPFIDSMVAFPLRMIVSHQSYHVLNLIGIPCIQQGTALLSAPNLQANLPLGARFQIDVANPCSGIHSLMCLLMFSALFGHVFLSVRWQQWAIFLSAIPFVIVGNVVRILMLVAGSIRWSSNFAVGTGSNPSWYHEMCGYVVFVVVLGLEILFGFTMFFMSRHRSKPAVAAPAGERDVSIPAPGGEMIVPPWRSQFVFGLALLLAIAAWMSPPPHLPSQTGVAMTLPFKVTLPEMGNLQFFGFEAPVSEPEHRILPKDTEFARKNYDDFHGHSVFFSIVLSGKQQYVIHPPEVCLVAQGWTIVRGDYVPVRLNSGQEFTVRNLTIQRDTVGDDGNHHLTKAYYMYWYATDGVTTPSRVTRNWISSRDRIFYNRDHRWAYVIAMSPITRPLRADGLDPQQTKEMLADFIRQMVPIIQRSEPSENIQLGGP